MTVAELIAKLQQFDPTTQVVLAVPHYTGGEDEWLVHSPTVLVGDERCVLVEGEYQYNAGYGGMFDTLEV